LRTDNAKQTLPADRFPPLALHCRQRADRGAGDRLRASHGRLLQRAGRPTKPPWTTPNRVQLELGTMQLRDFSTERDGVPTLVCAPFALHSATLTDFAPGHSLVQTLLDSGCRRLLVTDWRSASQEMRLLTIDNYLAELNVAIEEAGAPVDLVGLCQGGVMALVYAARFPAKVRKLVLVAAPVDVDAGQSTLTFAAQQLPLGLFDEIARLGEGRVQGRRLLDLWTPSLDADDVWAALQTDAQRGELLQRFRSWYDWTLDLPGAYYHQTVLWLFKENRLAQGHLEALGRPIDLGRVHHPLFLLAARDDSVVAPTQLMAVRRHVATLGEQIKDAIVPGGHLSLFMGARTLAAEWPQIGRWLAHSCST
jgi:poly(3-hydroxyalkanoate) synthetase